MKLEHWLIILLPIVVLCCGCSTVKEIPVQYIEKEVIRDSLIYITDSVLVEVPVEVVKEVLPALDTSYLKTSNAESVAYLDTAKRQINHTLKQSGTVKAQIDTSVKIQYVDRYITKEVPITVEVEKPYVPNWCWYLLIANILLVLIFLFKTYLKLKI